MYDTYNSFNIFRPLVDDVALCIGFNQTARTGANGGSHVRDEESTIKMSAKVESYSGKQLTLPAWPESRR